MSGTTHREWNWSEGLITALAVGGFLVILGVVFGLTPGIPQKIILFFTDLTGVPYPSASSQFFLPAPSNPAEHVDVYGAASNFAVGISILQVVILALRLNFRSPINKIAETIGNLFFWVCAIIAVNFFLLAGTHNGWFTFWASLFIFAGGSLLVQFLVHLIKKRYL